MGGEERRVGGEERSAPISCPQNISLSLQSWSYKEKVRSGGKEGGREGRRKGEMLV